MSITTRSATPSDITLLIGLMREFYTESNHALDDAWAADSFSAILQDQSRGIVWIAFDAETPVGYIVLTFRFSMEFGGVDGFIDDLYVRASFRRRGSGTSLLNMLFSECERRKVLAIHVETSASNLPALAFYQRHGLRDRNRLLLTKRLASRP